VRPYIYIGDKVEYWQSYPLIHCSISKEVFCKATAVAVDTHSQALAVHGGVLFKLQTLVAHLTVWTPHLSRRESPHAVLTAHLTV